MEGTKAESGCISLVALCRVDAFCYTVKKRGDCILWYLFLFVEKAYGKKGVPPIRLEV